MSFERKSERNYWQLLLYTTRLPLFIPVCVELRAVLTTSANAKCSLCFLNEAAALRINNVIEDSLLHIAAHQ